MTAWEFLFRTLKGQRSLGYDLKRPPSYQPEFVAIILLFLQLVEIEQRGTYRVFA